MLDQAHPMMLMKHLPNYCILMDMPMSYIDTTCFYLDAFL